MRTSVKKTSAFFLLSILVVIVLAGVIVLVWYVGRVRNNLVLLEEEVAVLVLREKQADSVGRFLDDIAQEEATIDSFFIHRDDVVSAIEIFEGLGEIVGGTVSLAQVDVVGQTDDDPGVLSVRLTASGSWASMTRLLTLLEHLPFHAELSRVSLATGSNVSSGPATWSLQAILTAELTQ